MTTISSFFRSRRASIGVLALSAGCVLPVSAHAFLAPRAGAPALDEVLLQEYEAVSIGAGLQAPNRAHGFRTRFRNDAIEVEPRLAADAWGFSWRTERWGRPGALEAPRPVCPPAARGARVQYDYEGLTEWYVNRPSGLEQGFAITRRPEGVGALVIEGACGDGLDATLEPGGTFVRIRNAGGEEVLRYGELHAYDAASRELSSRLEVEARFVRIVVDDAHAQYPVTIDPVLSNPAWTVESNQAAAKLGSCVAPAGDVNGDGYSDVLVGAPTYDAGETDEGRAWLYYGSPAGLLSTPSQTLESNQATAYFGAALAPAGDVNGDGFGDVIIGAWSYTNGQTDEGRAYVYYGSPSGLVTGAPWIAECNQTAAAFGYSVATAGDVNGDGYADVVVGAMLYDNGEATEGRAYVYMGSSGGLTSTPAWTAEGNVVEAMFGGSVMTAGDVNGDGFDDVIVGADEWHRDQSVEGAAFVYLGSAGGLSSSFAWSVEGNQAFAHVGESVTTAGDMNGDGYADIAVGARAYDVTLPNDGAVFVYYGSASGPAADPTMTLTLGQAGMAFGTSVASAGDVNGDGLADLVVGAPLYDDGETDEGLTIVYEGDTSGITLALLAESGQAGAQVGASVATAGDVNGDGYSDIIAGAPLFDNGQTDEGRAFVYHGMAAGLSTSRAWVRDGDAANQEFGRSVANAGDVNGDGYSDVIVGASAATHGETEEGRAFVYVGSPRGASVSPVWSGESDQAECGYGSSVAAAGDVNGDGYGDVIVGAPGYSNGEGGEGRAFVYHGRPSGLSPSPAWTGESNQVGAYFGESVASAGDVNGDGFADVIVGAHNAQNGQVGEGRAFVYHGSATGLGSTPAWIGECNVANAQFGHAVAGAGDVNGDGYSDVIVGAIAYQNGQSYEGAAFVYLGSSTGLAATPVWMVEGNQPVAFYGCAVASAGDVNGDGRSDVIVGAMTYHDGTSEEGRAFVYHGTATGVSTSAAWFGESNRVYSYFGAAVASAGDVNGDGYSDVAVGAPGYASGETNEGAAYVYHGSPTGLAPASAWFVEGNYASASLGGSVSGEGDTNGDGFADVIVGLSGYAASTTGGRAVVYEGADSHGPVEADRAPRQVRADDSAPIATLGASDLSTMFRLRLLGRTPAGRGRIALHYEAKPLHAPLNGTEDVIGPMTLTGVPGATGSSAPLTALVTDLIPQTVYHWRCRIVTPSPFFPHSRWFTPPDNAPSEAHLRTPVLPLAVFEGSPDAPSRIVQPCLPNPFRAETHFAFQMPRDGRARLAVVDVRGREVRLLEDGRRSAGLNRGGWDGRNAMGTPMPAGVYFIRVELPGRTEALKVVLAR